MIDNMEEWVEEQEKLALHRRFDHIEVGKTIDFGRDSLEDGDLPSLLYWEAIKREDDRVLLLSRYVIDCRPYNETTPDPYDSPFDEDFFEDENYDDETFSKWLNESEGIAPITWENSDLRAWLNGEFLSKAFNKWQREAILETEVSTNDAITLDRVFCLSISEAREQFPLASSSRCKPNRRAELKGVEVSEDDELAHEPEVVLDDHVKSASWWLRDICGAGNSHAAFVNATGGANELGTPIDSKNVGVRPAMWVAFR